MIVNLDCQTQIYLHLIHNVKYLIDIFEGSNCFGVFWVTNNKF